MKYIKLYEELEDFEEVWEEEPSIKDYKIVKFVMDDKDFQNGKRFYLTKTDNPEIIIRDFTTMEEGEIEWYNEFTKLTIKDKEKLKSGKYFITNGYQIGTNKIQKITYQELLDKNIYLDL